MVNHPNRSSAKAVKLTSAERDILVRLINIAEATEWDAGDYCLTQREFNTMLRASAKLRGANLADDEPEREEDRVCKDCGVYIGNNETGRCLTCQDAVDIRETGRLKG